MWRPRRERYLRGMDLARFARPIFEATELFARGVGEETDIVSKEMYTWEDRGRAESDKAQSLTLRPENTAGVVRAYIEHKLAESGHAAEAVLHRAAVPARAAAAGTVSAVLADWRGGSGAAVVGIGFGRCAMPRCWRCWPRCWMSWACKGWRLALNSVGSAEDRARYSAALREALAPVKHKLCEDNQRRAETNPLRVLDSKEPDDQEIIDALPKIADFLDEDSRAHFEQVKAALDACGVPYTSNPRLVRGLDYYTRTTFEFTVPDGSGLGTQNALLGGGRYDGLSEMLGGPKAPGIGFAIGEDRLILTLQAQAEEQTRRRSWTRLLRRWEWRRILRR